MSDETIVAVFETGAHADQAVRALEEAGVPSSAIERHRQRRRTRESRTNPRPSAPRPQSTGFIFWDMMFATQASHQDRPAYERSVERGETIVAVTVSEQEGGR